MQESAIDDPGGIQTSDLTIQKIQNYYQRGSIVGNPASYSLVPCTTETSAYFPLWLKQRLILPQNKISHTKDPSCVVHISSNKKLFKHKTECQVMM
jgi:hypothetical protein